MDGDVFNSKVVHVGDADSLILCFILEITPNVFLVTAFTSFVHTDLQLPFGMSLPVTNVSINFKISSLLVLVSNVFKRKKPNFEKIPVTDTANYIIKIAVQAVRVGYT